jgi:hypothetical protein
MILIQFIIKYIIKNVAKLLNNFNTTSTVDYDLLPQSCMT